jgi:hypothetical protein
LPCPFSKVFEEGATSGLKMAASGEVGEVGVMGSVTFVCIIIIIIVLLQESAVGVRETTESPETVRTFFLAGPMDAAAAEARFEGRM